MLDFNDCYLRKLKKGEKLVKISMNKFLKGLRSLLHIENEIKFQKLQFKFLFK